MKTHLNTTYIHTSLKLLLCAGGVLLMFCMPGDNVASADHGVIGDCGNTPVAHSLVESSGGGGGGGYSQGNYYSQATYVPAPTCSLSANPRSVPAEGGYVTLEWSSSNANGASLWGGNPSKVAVNGSQTLFLKPKTQTLQVWGAGGNALCRVGIAKTSGSGSGYSQSSYYTQGSYYAQGSYAPIMDVEIEVTPKVVRYGESATLTWDGGNATECLLTGGGFEETSIRGSREILNAINEMTFNIVCSLGNQTSAGSATLIVLPLSQET